jgi:CBS domain-containing protein
VAAKRSGGEPRGGNGVGTVSDVMRRRFVSTDPGEGLSDARQTMRLARLRHLVVTREERLLGILSYRDLVDLLLAQIDLPRSLATVADAMIRAPVVAWPSTSLSEAASRLCIHGVGCLPVVEVDAADSDEPRLLGLVTETDLLRVAFRRTPRS